MKSSGGLATAISPDAQDARTFRTWQGITLALLITGYAGYYLCRSNLSVCLPMIIEGMVHGGMDPATARIRLGSIASLGVLAYAIGKFPSGTLADFLGGRAGSALRSHPCGAVPSAQPGTAPSAKSRDTETLC